MNVPGDVTLRLFRPDDLPALVDLSNAAAEVDGWDERFDADSLRDELTAFNTPETDCWLAVGPQGDLAGFAFVELRQQADRAWGFGWGAVRPDLRRQGIGRRLLRAAEDRFAQRVQAEAASAAAIFIQRFLISSNPGELALARAEGYRELRSSYRMQIPLDRPWEAACLPEGFALRPFDPARDARAVFEADQAAFMDGGGQAVAENYETWVRDHLESARFNPAFWLVACREDAIAGVCFGVPWGADHPDLGWVERLGVLPPWRGRGLGEALLRESFYRFQQQGFGRVALGVRADNPGALNLYHRAGMAIYCTFTHYRKMLRGDPDAVQS